MPEEVFKNFALMIPTTAIYQLQGYTIYGAAGQEINDFKKWFDGQNFQQLQLNGMPLDMWIRYNDMIVDQVGHTLQGLFNNWKQNQPAQDGFTMTTHTYKKPTE
jgi:hypothetical protein